MDLCGAIKLGSVTPLSFREGAAAEAHKRLQSRGDGHSFDQGSGPNHKIRH
jgi:hypothetical protein